MANKIADVPFTDADDVFITASSRYTESKLVYYGELHKMTFTIYKRSVPRVSPEDKFTVIPAGWEYRPDLASKYMYGTVDFWWKIMEMNGMTDVLEFKTGTNIRLPGDVYGL